jgi:hypothetical protein
MKTWSEANRNTFILNVTYINTKDIYIFSMNVFISALFHVFIIKSIYDAIIYVKIF